MRKSDFFKAILILKNFFRPILQKAPATHPVLPAPLFHREKNLTARAKILHHAVLP
jgi:hypothetical protein